MMLLMELHAKKHSTKNEPTYVGLRLDGHSMDEVMKLAKGLPNKVGKGSIHLTVIYSKKPISYDARGELNPPLKLKAAKYSIFTTEKADSCLVVELDAPDVVALHEKIMKDTGASYDHKVYKPHITLSYDVGEDFDLTKLPPIEDVPELHANMEYAQKLDENWVK